MQAGAPQAPALILCKWDNAERVFHLDPIFKGALLPFLVACYWGFFFFFKSTQVATSMGHASKSMT